MTPATALTPELAVEYLRELSVDIRAVAVLTAAGEPLAGAPELVEAARALLAAAPDAAEIEVATTGGAAATPRRRPRPRAGGVGWAGGEGAASAGLRPETGCASRAHAASEAGPSVVASSARTTLRS